MVVLHFMKAGDGAPAARKRAIFKNRFCILVQYLLVAVLSYHISNRLLELVKLDVVYRIILSMCTKEYVGSLQSIGNVRFTIRAVPAHSAYFTPKAFLALLLKECLLVCFSRQKV